jgi:hypothetical protein
LAEFLKLHDLAGCRELELSVETIWLVYFYEISQKF